MARRLVFPLALVLITTLLATPLVAQDGDPIIDGVISMLKADVPETVIGDWLDTTRTLPRRPTPQDVVALKEAGASEELMRQVIELASRSVPPIAPPPPPATPPPPTGAETIVTPSPGVSPPPATTPQTPGVAEGEVLVRFDLEYIPFVDEEPDEPPWPMYVYLDGKPLSYVAPDAHLNLGGDLGVKFQRKIEVGRHIIQVMLEKHEEDGDGWTHASKASGETFGFDLQPGIDADIKVTFRQPMFAIAQGYKGPIDFRFLQGAQVLSRSDAGGRPDKWRLLCEDIEANIEGSMTRQQKESLLSCIRWDTMWTGVDAPPRSEVLQYLEAFEFKPVPRNVL